MGIAKLEAYFENDSPVEIGSPSYSTLVDANGIERSYFGYWITLAKPLGRSGHGHLYLKATPRDPTLQPRVVGPYQFSPQGNRHDVELEVAPSKPQITGVRYQSLSAAITWLKSQGAQNPKITCTETATFNSLWSGNNTNYLGQGYCMIEATAPITITRPPFASNGGTENMRSKYDGLWFRGSNITFDFSTTEEIYHEGTARNHVLDGVNITADTVLYKGSLRALGFMFRGSPIFLECNIHHAQNACIESALARGNTISSGIRDIFADSPTIFSNTVLSWDSDTYTTGYPDTFSVNYNGAETTATLAFDRASRIFTATWGAQSATFVVSADFTNDAYWPRGIVAWVNATLAGLDAGWSAALLDDNISLGATKLRATKGAAINNGFAAQNVKDTALALSSGWDIHSDWYQKRKGGSLFENVVIFGNRGWALDSQNILMQNGEARDWFIANNAFHQKNGQSDLSTQLAGTAHRHVMIVHNTMANQRLMLRTDGPYTADAYCLLANNVFREINSVGGAIAGYPGVDNHIHAAKADTSGSVRTTIGGDSTTLFVDAANGDFAAAPPLLAVKSAPRLPAVLFSKIDASGVPKGAPG
ncbi:hypothetical protein [Aurantiacibacter marinus]|nr:hypothetical protein [Aurantiacibacter marinus]